MALPSPTFGAVAAPAVSSGREGAATGRTQEPPAAPASEEQEPGERAVGERTTDDSSVPPAATPLLRLEIAGPAVVLAGVPFEVAATPIAPDGRTAAGLPVSELRLDGATLAADAGPRREDGAIVFSGLTIPSSGRVEVAVSAASGARATLPVRAIPGFLSLAPPIVAIVLAILLRQVVAALVAGIWVGATLLLDFNVLAALFSVGTRFVIAAMTDPDRAHIIVFSLMFGGMAGILSRGGGARGFAEVAARLASNARRGQLSTMLTAIVVFFDDYANIIIRGNLMRPITDGLRISREKLAFLVDTGAASVASTVIVSSWVGYEVGLIDQGLDAIGYPEDGYSVFLRTIPYRFYPIFSFIFALAVGFFARDFGPMRAAERRAATTGETLRPGSEPASEPLDEDPAASRPTPRLWMNGFVPVIAVLVTAGAGVWITGARALAAAGTTEYGIRDVVTNSDSYASLLWASIAGCFVAVLFAWLRRILTLGAAIGAWLAGLRSMVLAIVILVLAWSLGDVTGDLQAAAYLVQALGNVLHPAILPALTFAVAGVTAFATGSSWATMAVVMPLAVPLSAALASSAGLAAGPADQILMSVIGAVLAGAVFGDHCSPISDTTVLSSMASGCDHLDHVKTQLPYALSAAGIAIGFGILPVGFGVSPWLALLLGTAATLAFVRFVGRPAGGPPRGSEGRNAAATGPPAEGAGATP